MLSVYITDLQAYNEGYLVGKWLDLPCTDEVLSSTVRNIFKEGESVCSSPDHEEYFITDWMWDDVELFALDEYSNLDVLNGQLQSVEHLCDTELKSVSFLLQEGIAKNLTQAVEMCNDVVVYHVKSMTDLAYDLMQEWYNIHDLCPLIANNIDYEGIARELELEGCYHVFDDCIMEYQQ